MARTRNCRAIVPTGRVAPDAVSRIVLGLSVPRPVAAVLSGATATIFVDDADVTVAAMPSTVTSAAVEKPVPLMVMASPPLRRIVVGVKLLTVTARGAVSGAAMVPDQGMPMLTWPLLKSLNRYMARSATNVPPAVVLSRNVAKRRFASAWNSARPAVGQMLTRPLAGTVIVVVTPPPSSVMKVALTVTGVAAGLDSRKNVLYVRPPASLPSRPSANAHLDASSVAPAVAWPSRQGSAGVVGSPADGLPQYIARSATIGAVALTVMPKDALFSRASAVRPS